MNLENITKLRNKLSDLHDEQFDQRVGLLIAGEHEWVGSLAGWAYYLKRVEEGRSVSSLATTSAAAEARGWLGLTERESDELFGYLTEEGETFEKVHFTWGALALDRLICRGKGIRRYDTIPLWNNEYRAPYTAEALEELHRGKDEDTDSPDVKHEVLAMSLRQIADALVGRPLRRGEQLDLVTRLRSITEQVESMADGGAT